MRTTPRRFRSFGKPRGSWMSCRRKHVAPRHSILRPVRRDWQMKKIEAYLERHLSHPSWWPICRRNRPLRQPFHPAFPPSYGVSPYHHVLLLRVETAKRRLQISTAPLSEIALDCGLATNRIHPRPPPFHRARLPAGDGSAEVEDAVMTSDAVPTPPEPARRAQPPLRRRLEQQRQKRDERHSRRCYRTRGG